MTTETITLRRDARGRFAPLPAPEPVYVDRIALGHQPVPGVQAAQVREWEGPRIRGPQDIADHARATIGAEDREHMVAYSLDTRHRVTGRYVVTVGILDAALVHPREVFRFAIAMNAAAVILVHNHPSGDPTPSAEDRSVSRQMAAAGRAVGIRLLDHIVVGRDGYATAHTDGATRLNIGGGR